MSPRVRVPRARAQKIPRPLATAQHAIFAALLRREGVLPATTEWCFAKPRKWRFDYAWPLFGVAVEVEGGVWTRGRHTRGKGFLADMAKYNEAAVRGWKVLRVTPSQLCTLETVALIKRALTPTLNQP